MIAERFGEPVSHIGVFGEPGHWSATLIVNPMGRPSERRWSDPLPATLSNADLAASHMS